MLRNFISVLGLIDFQLDLGFGVAIVGYSYFS